MEQLDTKGQYPETGMILRVRQITYQAVKINAYELTDPGGEALPPFTAGAHIDFHFRDGSVRQYSLCNDPAERHRYLIAILREEHGRGGSQALHERLHVQRMVSIGRPRNNFPLAENATRSLLLAGGIGITPIMSMTYELQRADKEFVLHYCTRSPDHNAFLNELSPLVRDGRAIIHHDNGVPANGLDIARVLEGYEEGTHLYYCGPGFMVACRKASEHWPAGTVHWECGCGTEIGSLGSRARVPQSERALAGRHGALGVFHRGCGTEIGSLGSRARRGWRPRARAGLPSEGGQHRRRPYRPQRQDHRGGSRRTWDRGRDLVRIGLVRDL